RLLALSASEREEAAEGGHAVRRRAADGGNRAGADGAPQAAAAGRALDGARADLRRADLRDHPRDQLAGNADPAGRTERPDGARRREPRLRARDGQDRSLGRREEAEGKRGREEDVPRRHVATRSGKYGGQSRKPTRGGLSDQPRTIVSAAPRP